jgi:hypothetical protein
MLTSTRTPLCSASTRAAATTSATAIALIRHPVSLRLMAVSISETERGKTQTIADVVETKKITKVG